MRPGRHMKHTNLFLVRFWTEEPGPGGGQTMGVGAALEWHGRVQRVVDGESCEFKDWETFVDTLHTMLTTPSPLSSAGGVADATQVEPHPASDAKGEI